MITATAKRATANEAKRHFNNGGIVLVSERGHLSEIEVGDGTVTHSLRTTTWDALSNEVSMWRNRYPDQRFYILPDFENVEEVE